jgi:phosphoglycolate phosphatase-like HAD superfamily hydrolase
MFDLDGTLGHLRGGRGEDGNFLDALRETFGDVPMSADWGSYPYVSDYGIVLGLYREHHGRDPTDDEHQAVCSAYLGRVRTAFESGITRFELVEGAVQTVQELPQHHGWEVALATGGWRRTARFKLEVGGIDFGDRAQAFAEDGPSRKTIMRTALDRARSRDGRTFERVVYVGDAAWDARTCARLGWPFVGIGTGARAERLRALGTSHVLPDLADRDTLLSALDAALPPRGDG